MGWRPDHNRGTGVPSPRANWCCDVGAHQEAEKNHGPTVASPALCHGTMTTPNRDVSIREYAITTETAWPAAVVAVAGQSAAASDASRPTKEVVTWVIAVADVAKARNQPRTVETGRSNRAAITRCPAPWAHLASIVCCV